MSSILSQNDATKIKNKNEISKKKNKKIRNSIKKGRWRLESPPPSVRKL